MATDDYWVDAGRPDTFIEANLTVASHDASVPAVHAGARCHPSAVVTDSIVGDGATVGAGAVVRRSVLLPGASVGEGCSVSGSVVMGRVAARARIDGCVVGADGAVAEGEVLAGARIPQA
jgi:mannose-1-phosphate guanylyltransferase